MYKSSNNIFNKPFMFLDSYVEMCHKLYYYSKTTSIIFLFYRHNTTLC